MTTDLATVLLHYRLAAIKAEREHAKTWDRLARLDAAITICPVCDMRVIRPHRHAMEASAS
ncbi:MAG: hypothetical protein M0Z51_14745 [Propionibacterium sp.]|nr:hypothetical protein [Propionibacterium sp.]